MQNQKTQKGLNEFFASIYIWMFIGLVISAAFSYFTLYQGLGIAIFSNPILYYGLIAIQLAILFGTQILIKRLSPSSSYFLYFVYAALNGILLSWIFIIYTAGSIIATFLAASILFLGLAVYGFTTKKDLTKYSTVLFAAMWGVFFSSLFNILLKNNTLDIIISGIAILVFAGLTAYDNQAYQQIYLQSNDEERSRYVVLGALHMYINFVMIFVNLLKLFGNRR